MKGEEADVWREAPAEEKNGIICYGKKFGKRSHRIVLLVIAVITLVIMCLIPLAYSGEAKEAFKEAAGFYPNVKTKEYAEREAMGRDYKGQ